MRFVTPTIAKSPLHSTTRLTAIFDMIYYKFNDVRNLWGGGGVGGRDQRNHKEVLSIISTQCLPSPWKHSLRHLLDVSIQLLVPRLFRCTLKKIQLTLSIAKWTEYFAVNNSLYIITEMVSIPCLLFSQKHISDSFNIIILVFLFLFSNIIYM